MRKGEQISFHNFSTVSPASSIRCGSLTIEFSRSQFDFLCHPYIIVNVPHCLWRVLMGKKFMRQATMSSHLKISIVRERNVNKMHAWIMMRTFPTFFVRHIFLSLSLACLHVYTHTNIERDWVARGGGREGWQEKNSTLLLLLWKIHPSMLLLIVRGNTHTSIAWVY